MNKIIAILAAFASFLAANARDYQHIDSAEKNNWGANLADSPLGMSLSLQTKYLWRGMEMMPENAAPVFFPSFNYSHAGFSIYTMGGYATNGRYAEVDFGANYTWNGVTIGFNDYYYPTVDSRIDSYLAVGENTGHWLELCVSYMPEQIPVFVTLSNFFAGADKYFDEKGNARQAYSSYLEMGTYYDFLRGNRFTFACGFALNKSCYNSYERDFSFCNLETKYSYNADFINGISLPLSVAFIYNPIFDKSFVNFTASIAF